MALYQCIQCGTDFKAHPSKKAKFCSLKCVGLSKQKKTENHCIQCDKKILNSPSVKKIFCSWKCKSSNQQNRTEQNCIQCDKKFTSTPAKIRKFCSQECSQIYRKTTYEKKCLVCNALFITKPSHDGRFCSMKCVGLSNTIEYKDAEKMKQLTLATIETLDIEQFPNQTQFTDWQINDIFKLDIINTMDIGEDVTLFSLKNSKDS